MKLSVTPIYGWGWYMWGEKSSLDVPEPFTLEAETVGARSNEFLGCLQQPEHPLHGLWLLLSFRSSYTYNLQSLDNYTLQAFHTKPAIFDTQQPLTVKPVLTGYASAAKIS